MKKFNTRSEALEYGMQYSNINPDIKYPSFIYDRQDAMSKLQTGTWILFRHLRYGYCSEPDKHKISRPILGMFINWTYWDQAVVMEYYQPIRAWAYHCEVVTNPELDYTMEYSELGSEIEHIQFWTDNIEVLGYWKTKPNYSKLKKALS